MVKEFGSLLLWLALGFIVGWLFHLKFPTTDPVLTFLSMVVLYCLMVLNHRRRKK